MVRFLDDNFLLIALAVAGALYAISRWATRRRVGTSTAALPGIGPALAAGILSSALIAFASLVLNPLGWLVNRDRQFEFLWLPLSVTAAVVTLAVLIVYAIWPRPGSGAGADRRAFIGALAAVSVIFVVGGALGSAAGREAEAARIQADAAEKRAVADRSSALSIVVRVVDARLGGSSPQGGRIVSHLNLVISVRSTSDIRLIAGEQGANHWMNLSPETVATIGVQPEQKLTLPTHLPAGFDASYPLEVPIDELTWSDVPISGREAADKYTTGPWTARLSLYGAHELGTPQVIYTTTTSFTVEDAP